MIKNYLVKKLNVLKYNLDEFVFENLKPKLPKPTISVMVKYPNENPFLLQIPKTNNISKSILIIEDILEGKAKLTEMGHFSFFYNFNAQYDSRFTSQPISSNDNIKGPIIFVEFRNHKLINLKPQTIQNILDCFSTSSNYKTYNIYKHYENSWFKPTYK